jgi:hypothetical protein
MLKGGPSKFNAKTQSKSVPSDPYRELTSRVQSKGQVTQRRREGRKKGGEVSKYNNLSLAVALCALARLTANLN